MAILTNPPKIRDASDIPPLGKGRQGGDEDVLWREMIAAINGIRLPPEVWKKRAGNVQGLAGMGSDNHGQMSWAVWYLLEPDREFFGLTARQAWRQLSAWFLGTQPPPVEGDLCFFQASEPLSNDYDGYTLGSWLAVWDRALATGDQETAEAMKGLVVAWAAIVALSSMPPASGIISHHLEGSNTIRNPSLTLARVAVGARSTAQHLHADPASLILTDLIGYPGTHPQPNNGKKGPFNFWYLQISGRRAGKWLPADIAADLRATIDGDLEAADRVAALVPQTARWKGTIEIWRWQDLVLGVVPKCLNGNTAWNPLSVVHRDGPLESWFPWPKPKSKNLDSANVRIENGEAHVQSGFGALPSFRLPDAAPLRRYVLDEKNGFRVEGADVVSVPKEPEPKREPVITGDRTSDRAAELARAIDLLAGLKLGNKQRAQQAQVVADLRQGANPQSVLPAIRTWFRVDATQEQSARWREAIAILEGGNP